MWRDNAGQWFRTERAAGREFSRAAAAGRPAVAIPTCPSQEKSDRYQGVLLDYDAVKLKL